MFGTINIAKASTESEYLSQRRAGVGASDVAAICNLSKYSSAYDVYLDKTGQSESVDNKFTRWGKKLEGFVTELLRDDISGVGPSAGAFPLAGEVIEDTVIRIASAAAPHHRCTLDRILRTFDGEHIPVDLKTTTSFAMKSWDNGLPMEYFVQLQWQIYVTGAKRAVCYVAVLDARESFPFIVQRDDELIKSLIARVDEFWAAVQAKDPSKLSMSVSDWDKFRDVKPGSTKKAGKKIVTLIATLRETQEEISNLEDAEKSCKEQIKKHMGDAEGLVDDKDNVLATYKLTHAKPYSVPAKSYRKLVLVTPKEK